MTNKERKKLESEREKIDKRMKGSFVDPQDYRRLQEIDSLLMSDGRTTEIRLKVKGGKLRKTHRVTNFTRKRN